MNHTTAVRMLCRQGWTVVREGSKHVIVQSPAGTRLSLSRGKLSNGQEASVNRAAFGGLSAYSKRREGR